MKPNSLIVLVLLLLSSCSEEEVSKGEVSDRAFKMGFSTWTFGPLVSDITETYDFIQSNGDIYSEQVDDRIPWDSWINATELPQDFTDDIDDRVAKRDFDLKLVLSVSPLNTGRDDLIEGWDGNAISYSALNDPTIADAYFQHLKYLVNRLEPDYLIASMEGNDLLINAPNKWAAFKSLMADVRVRLKQEFPTLQVSESITLHNFFEPQLNNPTDYIQEVADYVNQLDFAAISFYPFFKDLHSLSEFQLAFDFLHSEITKTIAFVETTHLAEDLIIPSLEVNISSNPSEQKEYLEALLQNAHDNKYEFVIWWAHRDYDALWETFPDEVKDFGKVWRDTGILDENGNERPSYTVWQSTFRK